MPANDLPVDFMFDPMRFLNDEAVRTMRPHELGAYTALFCNGWTQPEPGILPDDDRLLAMLARCTPDEWAAVRPTVARCYDCGSRPGFWVQRGTVETAALRRQRIEAARASGSKGGRSRWGGTNTEPKREPGRVQNDAQATLDLPQQATLVPVGFGGVGLGMAKEQQNNTLVHADENPGAIAKPEAAVSIADWSDLFVVFWDRWPVGHKIGRDACESVWRRIAPRTREKFAAILRGLDRAKASAQWAKADRETGEVGAYIPNPATWLRQGRWNDDLAPANRSDGTTWARELENARDGSST